MALAALQQCCHHLHMALAVVAKYLVELMLAVLATGTLVVGAFHLTTQSLSVRITLNVSRM
jgi:hypothetical protein